MLSMTAFSPYTGGAGVIEKTRARGIAGPSSLVGFQFEAAAFGSRRYT